MKINTIATYPRFLGKVNKNKKQTAKEIANYQKSIRPELISCINDFNDEIKEQTPEYKNYDETFLYDVIRGDYKPSIIVGVIKIKDEKGNCWKNWIPIDTITHNNPENIITYNTQDRLWANGFYPMLQDIIETGKKEDEDEIINFSSYLPGEIKQICDQLESRSDRIKLNKQDVAKSIFQATEACPEEIKNAIINGFNEFTKNIETKTSDQKEYEITTDGGMCTQKCNYYRFGVKVTVPEMPYECHSLTIVLTDYKNNNICNVTENDITEKFFNPLTEEIVESGYKNLPFEDNPEIRSVYSQLK